MGALNVNSPFGFKPFRHMTGGVIRPNDGYTIADELAANIGYGNLVAKTGTGMNITNAVDGVAGAAAIGVFAGVKFRRPDGSIVFAPNWVTATPTFQDEGAVAFLYDDPRISYLVRTSGAFAATDLGQFAGIVVGTPNSLGVSQTTLNSADITGTLDNLKILRLAPFPGNDFASFAIAEVALSFHELGSSNYVAS